MTDRSRVISTALLLASVTASLLCAQAPPTLNIDVNHPKAPASPTLYGLMTEEINYSYDGGLYAEMVRNRTFVGDWSGIHNWYLYEGGNAIAKMVHDPSSGPSAALTTSQKIEISQADAQSPAGILNTGWWGYDLHPNTTYHGSFYAKSDAAALGPITVSLVSDNSGKPLASATVSGVNPEWKQYTFTLKTGAIQPSTSNHLSITAAHAGTLWIQLVSLFPPTYHDRPNGFRIDLMEMMAAMRPQFLRFPGGNYLEGDHIKERFDWKKTIGPLVDRPTHRGPWNYWSSDGMGLLEFLGWCEDLHMQPVLAVYAGYSLAQEHVNPGADLEPYVQDALDEIEYVTGGPDTKWGAERVKNGHPEPFKLTYVEIGNEDQFDRSHNYEGRYAQFYKAIKAKYPGLQLISTVPLKQMKPDVQDDHYYVRATQNFADAHRYDKADRNGPKIFVGEWATREGIPTPNMGAALGDAAWMTGLERNSDLIVMSCYAPLLVNVNPGGMQWRTDLIGYNALTSYGSPAYYAQKMFSLNHGDVVLAANAANIPTETWQPPKPRNSEVLPPAQQVPTFFTNVTRDTKSGTIFVKLVN